MGTKIQEFVASFDLSRAFRQFHKADNDFVNGNVDSASKHLERGLNLAVKGLDHIGKAVDDTLDEAASKFEKGNEELQKSIDAFVDGNDNGAEKHFGKAMDLYDEALDLVE